jgi:predicted dehydrogenase
MHTLLFLDPGHFHAALTLRVPNPRVSDDVFVYAREGPELRDFLTLIDRFNQRADHSTRWRTVVNTSADPFAHLVAERRGDAVVVAGRNGGKARTIRRLHEAGFHVLADKPWLVGAADLADIRPALTDWPFVMEIMTGRYDVATRLMKRLVDLPDVFGAFRDDQPAIELDGVHCLEKLVDGAPLVRPPWYFDVRVQGSGLVDITTHLVDRSQWLVDPEDATPAAIELRSAKLSATRVPLDAYQRITGEATFPAELRTFVKGDALDYFCNSTLEWRIGRVTARASALWELATPPGGGDSSRVIARGTRADVRLEQGPHTGHRRRLIVERRTDADQVRRALADAVAKLHAEFPGIGVDGPAVFEVTMPPALHTGHETHFAEVLDEFLRTIDDRRWPTVRSARTLAKYTLLAEAVARATAEHPVLGESRSR